MPEVPRRDSRDRQIQMITGPSAWSFKPALCLVAVLLVFMSTGQREKARAVELEPSKVADGYIVDANGNRASVKPQLTN